MPNLRFTVVRRATLSAAIVLGGLGAMQGCTDLDEVPTDALTPENAFKNDNEILAGAAAVYAQLRQAQWANYNLSEISSDEQIAPTRGTDWFDNGRWIEIHRHQWTANSGSALDDMNRQWNDMFAGVARANLLIDVLNRTESPIKEASIAELRTLRAWYYYLLMDFFGGVPIVTSVSAPPSARVSRDSVFRFIVSELNAARTVLPEQGQTQYGRVTRHVADAILANLYINAPVFQGTVTAAGLQRAAGRYQEAIDAADRVINSGKFSLEPDIRANFSTTNETSRENIFVIVNSSVLGLGMSIPQRSLHYNSIGIQAWNGFSVVSDAYRAFDPADQRRAQILAGRREVSFTTGQQINDRGGAPLVFKDTIADPTRANEDEGARLAKFPPAASPSDGDSHPNDYPFFRLAEMYMIKAEALNELGRTAEAIALINSTIRARAFEPDKPLAAGQSQAAMRQAILNERLYEFIGEAKRRQDLIRLGGFTAARRYKGASEPYRVLFPIPATQLQSNPLLVQNPGY
jgi:tetratricopeptide (TPR) repeat protein